MAKPQIFNRDMKRLAYLDNALAVGSVRKRAR